MIKYIIVSLVVSYIIRRYIFPPIVFKVPSEPPRTQAKEQPKKNTTFTEKLGEYTDYEEIK
jgi:hypothetical protein